MPQAKGSYSCDSETTMMTNRSNHMPMLMKIDMTKSAGIECRTRLNHSRIGTRPLQVSIVQDAHQSFPKSRFQKAVRSISSPLYHAMKNSVRYAYSTISEVSRHSLASASKCLVV